MSAAVSLRLYDPTQQQSPELQSLREVYERHLLPQIATKKAPKTLIDYETVLNDWERITGDLPISMLSRDALLEFQERLANEPKPNGRPRSAATVNKKFRTLGPLLRLCWPADSHNPGGLGLCDYFRPPERLREQQKLPFVFSFSDLDSLYRAASEQTWPQQSTALTWRTILVLQYCTGPRTYDLLSLRWTSVDWDYQSVGAITFEAAKTRKLQRIPLHPAARAHLRKLQSCSSSERIFPRFNYTNQSVIGNHWKALVRRAGVNSSARLEDLRKTCNTAYNDLWPGVGDWILGHSAAGVNARFYYNPTRKVLEAVQALPLPPSFFSLS